MDRLRIEPLEQDKRVVQVVVSGFVGHGSCRLSYVSFSRNRATAVSNRPVRRAARSFGQASDFRERQPAAKVSDDHFTHFQRQRGQGFGRDLSFGVLSLPSTEPIARCFGRDRLMATAACGGSCAADGAFADNVEQPGDRVIGPVNQPGQLDEGFLHHVVARGVPLAGEQCQGRTVAVEQLGQQSRLVKVHPGANRAHRGPDRRGTVGRPATTVFMEMSPAGR